MFSTLSLTAQETPNKSPQKNKVEHSFLWGLFKSEKYPKNQTAVFDLETSFSKATPVSIDTLKYEEKRALWGAIKWTQKRKKEEAKKEEER